MMDSFYELCGNLLFLGGTMAFGVLIASFIVSQTFNKDETEENLERDKETCSSSEDEDPEFESLYSLEDKEIRELDDAEKEALKNKHCTVETPVGDVLMIYKEPYFMYYAKSGSIIPYRFLDVVARKFVLDHDCLALYNKLEEEKKEEEKKEEEKKDEEKKEEEKKEEKEEKKEENSVFVVKKKKVTQKKKLVTKTMNKFKYGGQIEDYEQEKKREELESKEQPKKMTFSDYKKMMNSD